MPRPATSATPPPPATATRTTSSCPRTAPTRNGYQNRYCAWHDWNDDSANLSGGAAPSSYGNDIAFFNQPYNTDSGQGCGVNSGSAGATDGYTTTLGHEWHEMV